MNIKLNLLITLAVLGCSINAENNNKPKTPIRDRLQQAYRVEIIKTPYYSTRAMLLSKMIICMDCLEENHISIPETEPIAANTCFTQLSNEVNNSQRYTYAQEKELTLIELDKIGQKDLRRSWLWWTL